MAATAAVAARRLGAPVKLFTKMGDDYEGRLLLDELQKEKVDTNGVVIIKGVSSVNSFNLVRKGTGEKSFISNAISEIDETPAKFDTEQLKGASALLVDSYWIEAALEAVRYCRDHSIPVVGDFKDVRRQTDELLPFVDYLIIPADFARSLAVKDNLEDCLIAASRFGSKFVLITDGPRGGLYLYEGKIHRFSSFPVNCVDSTGAGDAFHGAFLYALYRGWDIHRAVCFSAAVGSLNTRALGGRTALPYLEEVERFIKRSDKDSNSFQAK